MGTAGTYVPGASRKTPWTGGPGGLNMRMRLITAPYSDLRQRPHKFQSHKLLHITILGEDQASYLRRIFLATLAGAYIDG